jgi:hypothetical protein
MKIILLIICALAVLATSGCIFPGGRWGDGDRGHGGHEEHGGDHGGGEHH